MSLEPDHAPNGRVVWITGFSGSGKTTIANLVSKALTRARRPNYVLDGDALRKSLNSDLGFSERDRHENVRRAGAVAALFADAGLVCLTAFISPFAKDRQVARSLCGAGNFIEVHLETPFSVCEGRDVKGLYKKARRGEILNFTGIDSPYEIPENPELRIDTSHLDARVCAAMVMKRLGIEGFLSLVELTPSALNRAAMDALGITS